MKYYFYILFLINYNFLLANDTLTTKTIIVEGSKSEKSEMISTNTTFLFLNKDLKNIYQSSNQLSEVLKFIPGLSIQSNGGLSGIKTISILGTNSSQSNLLLDGISLNSTQNSVIDLSTMPISIFDSFEMSNNNGKNGIGGNINLVTSNTNNLGNLSLSYGSFQEFSFKCKFNYHLESTKFSSCVEYLNSEGNYPFEYNNFGKLETINRSNSFLNSLFITNRTNTILNENSDLTSFIMIGLQNRGVPGAVLQGKIENSNAYFEEKSFLSYLKYNSLIAIDLSLTNTTGIKFNFSRYNDKDNILLGTNGLNNLFNNRDFFNILNVKNKIYKADGNLNFELRYSDLNGDMLQKETSNFVNRLFSSIHYNVQYQTKDSLNIFSFGLKSLLSNSIKPYYLPNLSYSYILGNLNLSIFYSNNLRLPSFNEMYYLNYGNVNLKPEFSNNYSFTGNYSISEFDFTFKLYLNNISDQIVAYPKTPVSWSAKNLSNVKTDGLFFDLRYSIKELSILFNYTLQQSFDNDLNSLTYKKLIPYIPQEMVNLFINYTFLENYSTSIDMQYRSFAFSSYDNEILSLIPNYLLLNIFTAYNFKLYENEMKIKFDIYNITDKKYEVLLNYPMQGRSIKISVLLTL